MEVIKNHFADLDLPIAHIDYAHDGKKAYDHCVLLLIDALEAAEFGDCVKPVDLIITDLQMPKMTGTQVLTQLRSFYAEC